MLMVLTSFLGSLVAASANPQFLHNVLLHTVPVASQYKNTRLCVCTQAKMLIIATHSHNVACHCYQAIYLCHKINVNVHVC